MPAQVCAPGEPPLSTSCADQILIMMFLDREDDELRSPTTILRCAVAVRPVQLKRGLLPAIGIFLSHRRGLVSQFIWWTFRIQKVPDVLSRPHSRPGGQCTFNIPLQSCRATVTSRTLFFQSFCQRCQAIRGHEVNHVRR